MKKVIEILVLSPSSYLIRFKTFTNIILNVFRITNSHT